MNVFEVVKGNVTARQAAEAHGLKVSRTDMACCPFHSEKSPSMKLAERYYCFGCGVTGDAVNLAEDFGLNYDSLQKPRVRPRIRDSTPEQKYQKEENHCYKVLTDYFHLLREWEKTMLPSSLEQSEKGKVYNTDLSSPLLYHGAVGYALFLDLTTSHHFNRFLFILIIPYTNKPPPTIPPKIRIRV